MVIGKNKKVHLHFMYNVHEPLLHFIIIYVLLLFNLNYFSYFMHPRLHYPLFVIDLNYKAYKT